jgi:phage terminase small subunit
MTAKSLKNVPNSRSKTVAARRRKVFVERYLVNGNNASEAAKFAGLSEKTAKSTGQRMLMHPEVQSLLGTRAEQVLVDAQLSTERWAKEMACIAHFDPGELYDDAGNLIPINRLPEHVRRAIASIEHRVTLPKRRKVELIPGVGPAPDEEPIPAGTKITLWDKNTALANIGKHLGVFEQDNRQRTNAIQVVVQLVG